jgi:mRNA-degrading endonuclease toxin of MazEF toxin-antitoxin module
VLQSVARFQIPVETNFEANILDKLKSTAKILILINTVIMLAIMSTLKFGELPGNVILRKGEAKLSKKCLVKTTQIKSVDKRSIKEKVGTLSKKRMDEVHEGLKIVTGMP